MRKSALSLVAVGVAAAVAISGCSSSKKPSTGTGTGTGTSSSGSLQVGVILPDTTTSNRYTQYDAPLLTAAFASAGVKAQVQNAHGSDSNFVSIAQTMITEGVKVLLIDPSDPATGISVEKTAGAAGVQVIDYDRVNLGGSAKYYVSFDNYKVGQLQAQGLVSCLQSSGAYASHPSIIMLNGGTDIDNNAVLFKAGAHSVLDPLFASGALKKGPEQDAKGWDNTVGAADFQQMFTQDPTVGGVLSANDGLAAAAIGTLKAHNDKIPITGQDATIQGLQYILQGWQCLTIFKNVSKEAQAASQLAIDLIHNDSAAANALATGSLQDPKNGRTIPSVLLAPEVITKSNIKDVITAGAVTATALCQGITAACAAAGISG